MTLQKTHFLSSKNRKILEYRKSHTLKETGLKFKISSEWVRQLEKIQYRKKCKVHNRFFVGACSHCIGEQSYVIKIGSLNYHQILREVVKQFKIRERDYLSVYRKSVLVKIMKSSYEMSTTRISDITKRHRSTIINLLNK